MLLHPSPVAAFFLRRFTSQNAPFFQSSNHHLDQVRGLCKLDRIEEALTLFKTIPAQPLEPPSPHYYQAYAALLHACARHGLIHQGHALHRQWLSQSPTNSPDLFLTNHLINMYAKSGWIDYAHKLFDEMPHRNVVSWTALVSGYAQRGMGEECFRVFSNMLRHCRPTDFAFTSVLSTCGGHCGRQVHALALKMSFDVYVFVANALISMYSETGILGFGGKDEAWAVFEAMEFRNLISWNSMIAGFQHRGLGAQAVALFSQMHGGGIGFDRATLLSVLSSFCDVDGINNHLGLNASSQLHCLATKTGFDLEIEVITALVIAYSNFGGEVRDCYRLFSEAHGCRDVVSCTGIITAFSERDPKEALHLFRQLCREGFVPDHYTFSVLLKICASFATEQHAGVIHSMIIKFGSEEDMVLKNALIHAYARCGCISLSEKVFTSMMVCNLVSWNSMLKAYALHGRAKEALQLFSRLDVEPDATTFSSLLSACSHTGLVEDGFRVFDLMFRQYNIVPELDHYACMVDILGRAGRVSEAEELIRQMPMKPDSVVWSALLGASRKHNQVQVAKLAATRLNELEPINSLGYVQMSNIYCSSGFFNEARLIRKEMIGAGIRKQAGLSWTEIENKVHEFTSGALGHPERKTICGKLEELVVRLKEMGYAPDTSLAFHDIDDEQREEKMYTHSEKLALVYAMMNEGKLHYKRGAIKIMKNIRICVDCHNFMKLASGFLQKEIIVRDSNRFHHFKETICSCNDYW